MHGFLPLRFPFFGRARRIFSEPPEAARETMRNGYHATVDNSMVISIRVTMLAGQIEVIYKRKKRKAFCGVFPGGNACVPRRHNLSVEHHVRFAAPYSAFRIGTAVSCLLFRIRRQQCRPPSGSGACRRRPAG
jgi:hypothetical protein